MSEQVKSAIDRARKYGIDITLLESSLRLTVEQRVRRLQEWVVFQDEIRRVRTVLYPQLSDHDTIRRVAEESRR